MHFAVDLPVIQSFLERKREESSTDDDECFSNDDNYDSESTSTSGSGSQRGEYSYHDTGCPAIWLPKYFIRKTIHAPSDIKRPSRNAP